MPIKSTYEELEKRIQELEQAESELKTTEKALRESKEKYKTIIENIEDAYYEVDITGSFTFHNDSMCKILGYSKDELTGLNNRKYMNEENAKKVFKAFNRVYKTGQPYKAFDWELIRKDGSRCYVETSVSLAKDSKGHPIGFQGIARDITERNRAEKALRASEQRFRNIVNASPMGIHLYEIREDDSLVFIGANSASDMLLGVHHEQFIGQTIEEAFPGLVDTEIPERYRDVSKNGTMWRTEQINYNEGLICGAFEVVAFQTEPGKMAALFNEITSRKQTEVALQESEEKFRTLVEESPLGVSLIGKDGCYKYINPRFEEMFSYTIDNIPTGKDWFKLAFPEKGYRRDVINTWINDQQETGIGQTRPRAFTVTCKNGSLKEIQFRPVTMENLDQFVIYEDITERIRMEQQLQQSQKLESIGILAGGVAHDFNNILTTIIGNASLALQRVGNDDTLREEIEDIKTAGERAASLTRQLLAFSRKQIIQPKVLDLNELLTSIEKMLGRLVSEDVELLTILEPALWPVQTDPGQMEQVIMNLVVNAKDAMPQGGKLTIETANMDLGESYFRKHGIEKYPGSYVMLAVSDTGIGMDKGVQEHIFDPFYTTKETGKGTGLGLSTIYGIVKQNNGFFWVYSELGQGSTFKVYLPKVKEDVELDEKKQPPAAELGGSETILLVEDDDSLRKLARIVLKHRGYKLLEAENGEDALKVIEAHDGSINLLITDVVMPKMGGREVAERLQPLYPYMKVLYMSGYTDNAIMRHGVLAPELNLIEKPFKPSGLARKVREILNTKV